MGAELALHPRRQKCPLYLLEGGHIIRRHLTICGAVRYLIAKKEGGGSKN